MEQIKSVGGREREQDDPIDITLMYLVIRKVKHYDTGSNDFV